MADGLVELDAGIVIELRYATTRNITGRAFYPSGSKAYLQREAAAALARANARARSKGFALKVWDAYRPASMQQKLWDACPDAQYVCPPEVGSKHSRGSAVDLTLVDLKSGAEMEMPTDHDVFTENAWPKSELPSAAAKRHRQILHEAMVAEGWNPVLYEWWHFDWPGWKKYPILDRPLVSPGERKTTRTKKADKR